MKPKRQQFVEVAPAVPITARNQQTYTYKQSTLRAPKLKPNAIVTIPFGKQRTRGTVITVQENAPPYPTKAIHELLPVSLTSHQEAFARWIAQTMQGGLGFTLRLFHPPLSTGETLKKINQEITTTTYITPTKNKRQYKNVLSAHTTHNSAYVEREYKKRIHELIQHAATVLQKKHQALILVPEKWMVDEIVESTPPELRKYLIAIRANKKKRELTTAWLTINNRAPCIVVGTQKALFMPYHNLDLVVIEEEQFPAHKLWDQYPRLHNLYAAEQLARLHDARIVYAASFPSLRLEHMVATGRVRQKGERQFPQSEVLPFTLTDRQRRTAFPEKVVTTIRTWQNNKERILFFHNRRGSWQTLLCQNCHTPVRCPECEISVMVHITKSRKEIKCHHCGWQAPLPQRCPQCTQKKLVLMGIGTEKTTNLLEKILGTRLVQIDADTVKKTKQQKSSPELRKKHIVATAALFTTLPTEKFDHVVWLFPERSMLYPDIRSEERTQALGARLQTYHLAQSSQKITIVTRQTEIIERTLGATTEKAIQRQLAERKRLGYPPYSDMVRLTVEGRSFQDAHKKAHNLRKKIEERNSRTHKSVTIRGPFTSFIKRHKGKAQVHLLLLGNLATIVPLYAGLQIDYVDLAPERIL